MQATAKKLIVQAKALANELKQRTLCPLLIQQQFIEKCDGTTSLYGNTPIFFKNLK